MSDEVVRPFDLGAEACDGFHGIDGGDAAQDGQLSGFHTRPVGAKKDGNVETLVRWRFPNATKATASARLAGSGDEKAGPSTFAGLLADDIIGGSGFRQKEGVPDQAGSGIGDGAATEDLFRTPDIGWVE